MTVAVSQAPSVSQISYTNVSMPLISASGVKVNVPSPLLVTVPLAGPLAMATLVGSRFPSASVSLPATSAVTGASSGVVALSSLATGGTLLGPTSTETVAVLQAPSVSQTS